MAKQNFLDAAWILFGVALAKVSSVLITATNLQRTSTAYVYRDEGAGAIVDGFDFTNYFKWVNATIDVDEHIIPLLVSQGIGSVNAFKSAGTKTLSFKPIESAGDFYLQLERIKGVFSFDRNTPMHNSFVVQNQYKVRLIRSGTTLTALLYDVDGGEAGSFAGKLVATIPLTLTGTENYQYLYPVNNLDDSTPSSINGEYGPLFIGPESVDVPYYQQSIRNNRHGRS